MCSDLETEVTERTELLEDTILETDEATEQRRKKRNEKIEQDMNTQLADKRTYKRAPIRYHYRMHGSHTAGMGKYANELHWLRRRLTKRMHSDVYEKEPYWMRSH